MGFLPFHVLIESVGFIFSRIWAAIKRESLAVMAESVVTSQIVDRLFQSVAEQTMSKVKISPLSPGLRVTQRNPADLLNRHGVAERLTESWMSRVTAQRTARSC
jgi:hypothetical protein